MASVGDTVSFTFTTQGRSSGVRHTTYAQGEVVRVGEKRLSVRVLDDPLKHQYWRDEHVGTIKVISHSRIIPELE